MGTLQSRRKEMMGQIGNIVYMICRTKTITITPMYENFPVQTSVSGLHSASPNDVRHCIGSSFSYVSGFRFTYHDAGRCHFTDWTLLSLSEMSREIQGRRRFLRCLGVSLVSLGGNVCFVYLLDRCLWFW